MTDAMVMPEADWNAPPNVRALFTVRTGGVGSPPFASFNLSTRVGDSPKVVSENRRRLRSLLPSDPKWLRQVHGSRVVCADDAAPDEEADASFTFSPNVVCAVMTADCLPVFLCASERIVGERVAMPSDAKGVAGENTVHCSLSSVTGVAVAHAGWRGLASGVLENTVAALRAKTSSPIVARIAPGISAEHYPVGPEVREALLKLSGDESAFIPADGEKWHADLKLLARRRLESSGVSGIVADSACTFSDSARFFSARRDKTTGRMSALIWFKP